MPERANKDSIDYRKSDQYTLSIRLSADGFSFSIDSPVHEKPLFSLERAIDASLSLMANLKQAVRELDFLNYTYKRVHILWVGKRFTLVPLAVFEDDQAEVLFGYNHASRDNEIILYNVLKRHNLVVVFGMDRSAHAMLSEQYPHARFYSQISAMSEYCSVRSRAGSDKKIYASVRSNAIDLCCYERGGLLLANSFECKETEDRIYYLLHVWKQLELDQERDELYLTGAINGQEAWIETLRKYIQEVVVMPPQTAAEMQNLLACD